MLLKVLFLSAIFVIVASPATYRLTSRLLGSWVSSGAGCPTQSGVVLHGLVFAAAVVGVMLLSPSSSATESYKAGRKYVGRRGHTIVPTKLRRGGRQLAWDATDKRWVWLGRRSAIKLVSSRRES